MIQIARANGVQPREMITPGRNKQPRRVADARFIAYRMIKNDSNVSNAKLAVMFHRSKQSVINGLRKFDHLSATDAKFRGKVRSCIEILKNQI